MVGLHSLIPFRWNWNICSWAHIYS